jgi:hypothetical protein
MPESLKFLLSKKWIGKFWKEFEKFQNIAQMSPEEVRDLKVVVAKYEGMSKLSNLKKRSQGIIATLKAEKHFKVIVFNILMMFLVWSAMSFGINLLTFYTKYLPGDVFNNSMVIGLAALIYLVAGPLAKKLESKNILSASYLLASISTLTMIIVIQSCNGDQETGICGNLSILIFVTRCGLNVANCFIFIIHTEIFPTFFLATSYGLCNFFGRSLTLAAPLVAENPNKMLPLIFLMFSSILGMIGAFLIKKIDLQGFKEKSTDDDDDNNQFDQLINTSIIQ